MNSAAPLLEFFLDQGRTDDLRERGFFFIARFPFGDVLRGVGKPCGEVIGLVEGVGEKRLAEPRNVGIGTAAERGAVFACGGDDHRRRIFQRVDEAARIARRDDDDFPADRCLGQRFGEIFRRDLVQRQRIHIDV